eukprot:gb/GECG01010677.1/.p1 GENE.gb/GECG01010677.1/~~gb/GECG01010677.1/.p1  ORF type:complete len:116 (+),score=9.94 gb/GECG01010677.1/:1-348(+)
MSGGNVSRFRSHLSHIIYCPTPLLQLQIGELIRGIFPNFSKLLQEYHSGDNISLDNSLTRSTGKRARAQDSTLDTHGKDKAQSKSTKHGSSFAASNKRQKKGRRAKKRKMATETA